jgi:NADH-quinone oxidoreductase subunit N
MSVNDFLISFNNILYLSFLVVWASLLLLVDLFIPQGRKIWTAVLAAVGLVITLVILIARQGVTLSVFNDMIRVDSFSTFLSILLAISGILAIAVAYGYLKRMEIERGEYYSLLLFSIVGMMLMTMANDLIVVFLALELLSIPLYILAGFAVPHPESEEAAIKYFLLGAFSSAIMVYGIAIIFGATATTSLPGIVSSVADKTGDLSLLVIGGGVMLIGLGFKVAAVPFHMWTPDVYQGSPSSVTAFMAIGAKVAGFAALTRILVVAFSAAELAYDLTPILWVLSALTVAVGNIIALVQKNIKRLLAYSSIANAGFILMALVPYGQEALTGKVIASVLFYLLAYLITNFAAWAVVITLERKEGKGLEIEDYAGLSRKYPWLALTMTLAMLSFIGIPPTVGFMGKFFVFSTVLAGGYTGLALIGVIASLISAYYYLRVVVVMYMKEGEPIAHKDTLLYATALASGLCVLLMGIFSEPLITWATQAVMELF